MMKNKITVIILIAVVFGLSGGVVGSLLARVYLFESLLKIPLFGDIDLSQNPLSRPNVIISGARNVVVEQDAKVADTLKAVEDSMLGIYKKKATSSKPDTVNIEASLNDWYKFNDFLGQGFVITSDGWVISSFSPQEVIDRQTHLTATTSIDVLAQDYVLIDHKKNILLIDRIIYDPVSQISFYHAKSRDLTVKNFVKLEDVHSGQLVVAVNWEKQGWLTTVLGHSPKIETDIKSSDYYQNFYVLEQAPPKLFNGAFLFTLNNGLVAIINNEGRVLPVDNFSTCLNCLLDNNVIERPRLGVTYIDLSEYVQADLAEIEFGALIKAEAKAMAIKPGTPADIFGLQIEDIILAIDNIELKDGKTLSGEINKKLPDDETTLLLRRDGREIEIKIVLDRQ